MSSAFNIPAGFALLPLEPTPAMIDAGLVGIGQPAEVARAIYLEMLAAAPTPPVDAVPGEPVAMGCHCDLDPDSTPDGCVLDSGRPEDCTRTKSGKITRREDCDEWKPIRLAASVASRAGSEPVATDQAVAAPEASRQGEAVAEVNNIGMLKATPHGTRTLKAGDKLYAAPSVLPAQEVDEADFDANLADPPTSQDSAPIAPAAAAEPSEPAHSYALGLATTLWTRYYKAHAPNWEPLEDTLGLLTQIDNMIAGLLPDRERAASLVASEDEKWLDWERELIAAAQAVIERWDTPLWKDAPHTAIFINRMREAIDAARASAGEAQS